MKFARRLLMWLPLCCGLSAAACSSSMPDQPPTSRMNLAMPTLGGKQLWGDVRWQEGWRVQKHVLTGHFRLLDPQDRRLAWGELEACIARMQELAPERDGTDHHLVLLIHGMGRSRSAFAKMQKSLQAAGMHVGSLSYPSTRQSVEAHALQVAEVLEHLQGYSKVSFVTHSLGGIVVRQLLHDGGSWRHRIQADRLVMLAPPNQGAAFADRLQDNSAFRWVFGDTGQALTSEAMASLAQPDIPFLVIAGARGDKDGKGWNPMLDGDDDWVVRVSETHLPDQTGHITVPVLHTFLMNDEHVIGSAGHFLATGEVRIPHTALAGETARDENEREDVHSR
ncbi:MAG: esterase/lipase family protein [Planctomycetota bacterium]